MSENKETKNDLYLLYLAVIFVMFVWFLNWILLCIFGGDSQAKGQFGDMFGSVNALFTGLTFSFLIYTTWTQREEQKRQAQEIQKTSEIQANTLKLQKQQIELNELQIKEINQRVSAQIEPKFIKSKILTDGSDATWKTVSLCLKNIGAYAFDVKIVSPDCNYKGPSLKELFQREEEITLVWSYNSSPNFPSPITAEISYKNVSHEERVILFKLNKNETDSSEEPYELEIVNNN